MNTHICKNCEHVFNGNHCPECSQKSNTVRLDWHFIKDELKYTFLHINKGLLYTAKQLFTRPGDTVREFIEGKRVKHYKPILLVFVLAGLNGLLHHYLNVEKIFSAISSSNSKMKFNPNDVYEWVTNHYALFELGLIPIISFCSWLAFKKWGYNYVENVIINCYASGMRLLVSVIIFPIQYIFQNTDFLIIITIISGIIPILTTIWLYIQLYKDKNIKYVLLRLFLFLLNFLLVYLLIIIAAVVIYVIKK
jgi:Protein of unknown function (DUF3667)